MSTALIDGDELAYKISSTYQSKIWGVYKDDKLLWKSRTREDAIESIEERDDLEILPIILVREPYGFEKKITDFIDTILNNTNSSKYIICLSGEENFRYSLASILPYKGNRDGKDKPGHYLLFRKYLLENLEGMMVSHLEADDLLTHLGYLSKDKIICSTDKDLRTVPSINYNISTKLYQKIDYSTALYNFYYQLLIGDGVDNIPSPYNLGPITAKGILEELIGSNNEENYYQKIYPYYVDYLTKVDKEGNYKTKWFNDSMDFYKILWEVGNLIYMHRTLDPEERWKPPIEEEINGEKEECKSQEERELVLL